MFLFLFVCLFFYLFCFVLFFSGFSFGAEATTFSILPVYFEKYYDISNSFAHVGLSVGVMVMPLLTQFFFDIYGWRGTILILAALNMHIVLSGALLIPVQQQSGSKHPTTKSDPDKINTNSKLNKNGFQMIDTFSRILDLDFFKKSDYISLLCATIGTGYYYTGWLIYLVPHAEDLGFSPYAASALATTGGVGNLAGSCAFPFLIKMLSSKSMILLFHFIAFASLAADPVLSISPFYFGLTSATFVLNFAYAIWGCAYMKESKNTVHESRMHSFLNWSFVTYGIGSILSGFTSGKSISESWPRNVHSTVLLLTSLTAHNWQKWKRVFLTCRCHKMYREEIVDLISWKYTWKITIFVNMWNFGQFRWNLIFCQ